MKTKTAAFGGILLFLILTLTGYGQSGGTSPASEEMTGTIKEYTPGTSLVLERLAPSEPVQFKLAKNVTFNDTDGKAIDAAGLTTNRHVRVHYARVGGDYVADKISLISD